MVEEMGQSIMRNWDLREFGVRVNWPSPIWQVRALIWRVITPIRGLPNPIRQVLPLIAHIHSYPPHCSHLHPPSLSFSSTSQTSSQNRKLCHPSLSLHGMIMSWHRVQHTLSTALKDCLSSLHSHDYELTPECSFSFRHASIYDRPPSASSPWELKGNVTLSDSHGCELTNWWNTVSATNAPSINRLPVLIQSRSITASKCISILARSRPPSASPNSLNHRLQVYLQTRTITASICISEFSRSWPPSASPSSLDLGLQVHLSTRSITASKYILISDGRCTEIQG